MILLPQPPKRLTTRAQHHRARHVTSLTSGQIPGGLSQRMAEGRQPAAQSRGLGCTLGPSTEALLQDSPPCGDWRREASQPQERTEVRAGPELTMMMYQLLTTVSSNKVTAGEVGCASGQCQRPSLSQSKCLQGPLPPNLSPPERCALCLKSLWGNQVWLRLAVGREQRT